MTDKRTYRHRVTGLVGDFDRRVALADSNLIEVEPGTKPLAYTPIPKEAVEEILALQQTPVEPDEELGDAPETPEEHEDA